MSRVNGISFVVELFTLLRKKTNSTADKYYHELAFVVFRMFLFMFGSLFHRLGQNACNLSIQNLTVFAMVACILNWSMDQVL